MAGESAAPDRYTAINAATGLLIGLRGHPFGTALTISVLVETAVQVTARVRPDLLAAEARSPLGKSAVDVAASMLGWVAARALVARAPALSPPAPAAGLRRPR